ncbi:GntR family transcriptional regulator [Segnochrobactraceae bacterium EtOH-i3]
MHKGLVRTPPAAQRGKPGATAADISRSILDAVVEQRLPPGTKLAEEDVGALFGVSRTVVRAAFQSLAHEGVIVLERNRGAFVARPSAEEARNVLAARRLIEPQIAREVALRATPDDLESLAAHIEAQREVLAADVRDAGLRLSGEFHLVVATILDNPLITRMLRELIARSSLVIALYGRSRASVCSISDHQHLVDALKAGDADAAAHAMLHHIDDMEADLDLETPEERPIDLASVLTPVGRR